MQLFNCLIKLDYSAFKVIFQYYRCTCVSIKRGKPAAEEWKVNQESQERRWVTKSPSGDTVQLAILRLKHPLVSSGGSRHGQPSRTSRKWRLKGYPYFIFVNRCVCWTNVLVSLLTHHVFHATLCLIQHLVKGKSGEKGPRGKQGSPVSD